MSLTVMTYFSISVRKDAVEGGTSKARTIRTAWASYAGMGGVEFPGSGVSGSVRAL